MNNDVPIFFPVETINRELDVRLFLACAYVRPKHRIFVGFHGVIYSLARRMRGGLFVGKHFLLKAAARESYARYHALKDRAFLCVHLDEEGAVYPGNEENWQHRLSWLLDPCALSAEDYVCTWGDFQRDYYLSLDPSCAANIRTTGHPRFDLYKLPYRRYFDADATRLKEKYGDFILINGNFTIANNGLGLQETFSERCGYYPTEQIVAGATGTRRQYFELWASVAHVTVNFVRLVNRLSLEFPNVNIVIRPHPTEDWDYYRIIFNGVPNVHVEHTGSVAPWLLACAVVIHDGCTTAIEAYLNETPIINYRSVEDVAQEFFLPSIFGFKLSTEGDVVEKVRALLREPRTDPPSADFSGTAHDLLANLTRDAFGPFMDVMCEAEAHLGPSVCRSRWRIDLDESIRSAINTAKAVVRPLFPDKQRDYTFFTKNVFGGFTESDIEQRLASIQTILQKPVQYTYYSDSLIEIHAPS